MDIKKREFLRTSMLGAITSVSPLLLLNKVASAQQSSALPAQAPIPLTPDAPLVVRTQEGWFGIVRQDDQLVVRKAGDPTSSPINQWTLENPWQSSPPAPDGTYSLGPAGRITVRKGVVESSDLDQDALKVEWDQHSKVKVDALEGPLSENAFDNLNLSNAGSGAFIAQDIE